MTTTATSELSLASDQQSISQARETSTPHDPLTENTSVTSDPINATTPTHTSSKPTFIEQDTHDDEDTEDQTTSLERDHPSFTHATISLIVQLLPEDGHTDGRLTLIAVKSHNLPAHMTMQRLGTLGPLPASFTTVLNQWETALPEALSQRTLARAKEHALQQLKDAERKAKQAATKRPDNKKPERSKPVTPITTPSAPSAGTPSSSIIPESQPHLF